MNGVLEGFDDGLFTAAELADAVRTEVARLHHLAGDLAAVSRAEEGRLQLDRQAGDLREVITSVAERLRPRFDTAGIGLTVEAPTALPATFDHERMVQVLTNLIGLAGKRPVGIRTLVDPSEHRECKLTFRSRRSRAHV